MDLQPYRTRCRFCLSHVRFSACGLAGLTSTATRFIEEINSRSSSIRFAANSPIKKLMPEKLLSGLARLVTRANLIGSSPMAKTIGLVAVATLAAIRNGNPGRYDDRDTLADQIACEGGQPIELVFGPAEFDRDVFSLDIACLSQTLMKAAQSFGEVLRNSAISSPVSPGSAWISWRMP